MCIRDRPFYARQSTELLAKAFQAAQLIKSDNALIADAFCEARLNQNSDLLFGTLSNKVDCTALLKRYVF